MMNPPQAAVLFAPGFEEIEAVSIVDVLRRVGIQTTAVSITDAAEVTGSHQITVRTDQLLREIAGRNWDAVVCPGGMPGSMNLAEAPAVRDLLRATAAAGGVTAAVCAAPLALHAAGLLHERTITCFPGVETKISEAVCTGRRVEVDGRIVTGLAAGAAAEFALAVAEVLGFREKAAAVRASLHLTTG